jgi:hypothetical protein
MKKISNNQMSEYVTKMEQFKTNNGSVYTTDQVHPDLYIVYSYGVHWPMYIYDNASNAWFGNSTKYNKPTTNKHTTLAKPDVGFIHMMPKQELDYIIEFGGYAGYCAKRCMGQDVVPMY